MLKRCWISFLNRFIEIGIILSYCSILVYILTGGFSYALIEPLKVHNIIRPITALLVLLGIRLLSQRIFKVHMEIELFENPGNIFIVGILFYLLSILPVVYNKFFSFRFDNLQVLFNFGWARGVISLSLIIITLQVFSIAIAGGFVYFITKEVIRNNWWALVVGTVFLAYPFGWEDIFFSIRLDCFAMLSILVGIYFFIRKRYIYAIGSFVIGIIIYINTSRLVLSPIWSNSLVIPSIFTSYVLILEKSLHLAYRHRGSLPFIRLLFCIIPLSIGIVNFNKYIVTPLNNERLYERYRDEKYELFFKIKQIIPPDAELLTVERLLPYFIGRGRVFGYKDVRSPRDINYFLCYDSFIDESEKDFFGEILNNKDFVKTYEYKGFIIGVNLHVVDRVIGWSVDFSKETDLTSWELSAHNTEFNYSLKEDLLEILTVFKGGKDEDEFIQMRRAPLCVDVVQYPYFLFEYKVEEHGVQIVEIVFGIDINGDRIVDKYIHFYPEATGGQFDRYEVFLYGKCLEEFPGEDRFELVELELYPHKRWEVDCSEDRRGGYRFWLKGLSFYGFRYRGMKM